MPTSRPSSRRDLADPVDVLGVLVGGAVGEVEAEDVDSGLDQLAQHLGLAARRPDGGDDLGAARSALARPSAAGVGCGASAAVRGRGLAARLGGGLRRPPPPAARSPAAARRRSPAPGRPRPRAARGRAGRRRAGSARRSRAAARPRGERVEGAERGDQGEHVALDRDVLAAGAALEQEDEAEPEDRPASWSRRCGPPRACRRRRCRRGRSSPASRRRSRGRPGTANAASARSSRPR